MNFKSTRLNEESITQKTTYCMSPFIWNSKSEKATMIESSLGCQGPEGPGKGTDYQGAQRNFGGLWKCSISWFWWWLHNYIHVKTYWIIHLKLVTTIVYKLHFNIADKKSWRENIFTTWNIETWTWIYLQHTWLKVIYL